MSSYISLQRVAYFLIILVLSIYILIVGQTILTPIAFSVFLAFLINPIMNWFETKVGRISAVILTFLSILIPLLILLVFLVLQSMEIFGNLNAIGAKLKDGMDSVLGWLQSQLPFMPGSPSEWFSDSPGDFNISPLQYLRTGVTSTTAFLANLVLTVIYTILVLLYRSSLKNFTLLQLSPSKRTEAREVLRRIQTVIQQYLHGLGLIMLVLFVLNSLALSLIGIEYPIFWGGVAAFLAIIPYVGTLLGGMLPFLYAVGTTDTLWQPLAVFGAFAVIQFVEGNFITPKVMGDTMRINPFVAIFSLILGGAIWGVAGLILALPVVAVLKVLFSEVPFLKPVSILLSSAIVDEEKTFLDEYDKDEYRLRSFFSKQKKV